MNTIASLGLTSSKSILPLLTLVTGVASGACNNYTCQDTATCPLAYADAGQSSTGTTDTHRSSTDNESSTSANDESAQPNDETRFSNDSREHTEVDETSNEADASVSSEGSGEAPDDATISLDAGVATSDETKSVSDVATSAASNTTDTNEQTSAPPPARCNPDEPFGRPFPVAAINLANEIETVAVSPNGLTAYVRYGSDPTMYQSTRDAVMEDFGSPQSYTAFDDILELNSYLYVKTVGADGLTAYLSESTGVINSTSRQQQSQPFEHLTAHEELTISDAPIWDPWLSSDGERLYGFVAFSYRLATAQRREFGFTEPVIVDDGTTLQSSIYSTILTPSETVLYSTVNQVGEQNTVGLAGIARGRRSSISDNFVTWEYVAALDGLGWDAPLWVSDDECEIVLRQDGEGSGFAATPESDVFIARRAF